MAVHYFYNARVRSLAWNKEMKETLFERSSARQTDEEDCKDMTLFKRPESHFPHRVPFSSSGSSG